MQVEVFPLRNCVILAILCTAPSLFAAEGLAKVFDDQLSTVEREVLGLAQKMPADKYDFAPTSPWHIHRRSDLRPASPPHRDRDFPHLRSPEW